MTAASIDIAPLSGSLGAEIFAVNLAEELPESQIAQIRRALVDYGVVFFRDQEIDPEQQKRFARRFGNIFIHPNFSSSRADPEIIEVRREPGDLRILGEDWHSDTTMMSAPPMGAILYGMEIPPYGGDTLFSSQRLAYEALSAGMKRLLKGLRAIHSDRNVAGPQAGKARNAKGSTGLREDAEWQETRSLHPVVCVHPESGKEYLFVNHTYTIGFEDMTEDESRGLLEFLMDHGHRPEFTCRFRWRKGSVAFWDNRQTKHLAIHDAGQFRRVMRRLQIAGEPPVPAV